MALTMKGWIMTANVRLLLATLMLLLGLQWILLPVISWQNGKVSTVEKHFNLIAVREATIESLPDLQAELTYRSENFSRLRESAFNAGPTSTLEIQQRITSSLTSNDLKVSSFEWGPETGGSISTVRAQVRVVGSSKDLFDWISALHLEEVWVSVLALKLRHADSRRLGADMFSGDLSLEFILSEANRG